jgi:hypothetical protein
MRIRDLYEDGRIVKGVNTTSDVGTDEIKKQAAKFGNSVDKDGKPPTLSKKVKGKSTNVLFNLGLTEGIKLRLERDKHIDVLHIQDTKEKHRVEVRGKKDYESGGYDPTDKLHQVLDRVGKAANISDLINGEVVHINPGHPQGSRAIRTARDVLQTENDTVNDFATQRNQPLQGQSFDLPIPVRIANPVLDFVPQLRKFVIYNEKYGIVGVKLRTGKDVKDLQRLINDFGGEVKIDGEPGPKTERAFILFIYEFASILGVKDLQTETATNISKQELRKQLEMGIEVEMEHTDDPNEALRIAIDHIKEDPLYYDHLKFVEGRLKSRSYRKSYRAAKASGKRKRKKLRNKFRDDINNEDS